MERNEEGGTGFSKRLIEILGPDQVHRNEPMSDHTTFRAGGPADWFVETETVQQLAAVLEACRGEEIGCCVLGNGSNLLVGDKGYRGVMISLGGDFRRMEVRETVLEAGGGALLASAAQLAAREGLSGLEFAAGIPGSVGGAVVMNAGAYGSEICGVLKDVQVLSPEGQRLTLGTEELELGYRTSCIPELEYTVLSARFQLEPGDREQIQDRMRQLAERRREKQPLNYPSAGSTFKRPEGFFAGKLIEEAGLKGLTLGGAQVSEKHSGFVINRGQATASDIRRLCELVQEKVYEQFGVELELEVKLVGEF